MFCFMKIDDARELFDVDDTEYNVVFSDHELDIPTGILYSTLTKQTQLIQQIHKVKIDNIKKSNNVGLF